VTRGLGCFAVSSEAPTQLVASRTYVKEGYWGPILTHMSKEFHLLVQLKLSATDGKGLKAEGSDIIRPLEDKRRKPGRTNTDVDL
jgi:hypothetical protein